MHVSEIAPHSREYWLFGLLFGVAGALQLAWAELVRRFPRDELLLLAGALLNLSIAWVWAVSRTEGLPIGPHAWVPEDVGVRDVLATSAELGLVGLVALVLVGRRAAPLAPAAWLLAAANVAVAFA